ncbi:E3 ubiquitin-protein ligase UHRF1-like isoform X2 [Anthonomus grandis grandis]|uniref:E3 ubiquitin-protein ligase UHRF1-like isoform X2 n=1 Tax=Anthonomus grandis grandis TaxID=2921223 RepID=UPI002165182B|nr:E3 ubiquitin-protein ligase UHRF1-like isoform X2 [Anthonomus grandis grandis]
MKELPYEIVNVDCDSDCLILKMVDGQILNDYSVLPNDVIVVMKRQVLQETNLKTTSSKDGNNEQKKSVSKETTPDCDQLVDAMSDYYRVGDFVDVRLLDTGAWYEAVIEKILKKDGDEEVDKNLIFRLKSASHVSVIPFEEDAKFENIRPRSYYVFKVPELMPEMTVLANFNIDSPKERGFWYDFHITQVGSVDIIGTIVIGNEKIDNCNIKFIQECMRIEEPILNKVKDKKAPRYVNRKYPFHCKKCKDDKNKTCRSCGCHECGGKENWDKIILCDECDMGYHTDCLDPPMDDIPEDDWYCPSCKTDDSQIVKAGEKLKISKKKLKTPAYQQKNNKDWGRGMACVGLTKTNDKVPHNHVGSIPGVEVGFCWKFRHGVAESGVHRPPVAGIHGKESDCAYSVVLSGGYEDDIDYGHEFLYTGAGGRDLSGNKRTSVQSFDQELNRTNKALALNCNAKFNNKDGAEAEDWKGGRPVRVVRSYKSAKHSEYAPQDGYRYDGLYKVVKYYPEKGKSGFIVWRYLLRRDDPCVAPWEKGAKQYEMIYPEGYLEMEEAKRKKEEMENKTPKKGQKRKANSDVIEMLTKKKKSEEYDLDKETLTVINADKVNEKLWNECKEIVKEGKKQFLDKVEETFTCIICITLVYNPVTLKCSHNLCKKCLHEAFKHCSTEEFQCPHCREMLGRKETLAEQFNNKNLQAALNFLFPGYRTE